MEVKSIDAVPAQDGPEQYFSGRVQIRPLFSASEPARMSCGCVTFDPCARSAWHTHPLGQTLIVMSGRGFV
jgi:quercetin dioxygenase-like cupin family protein